MLDFIYFEICIYLKGGGEGERERETEVDWLSFSGSLLKCSHQCGIIQPQEGSHELHSCLLHGWQEPYLSYHLLPTKVPNGRKVELAVELRPEPSHAHRGRV